MNRNYFIVVIALLMTIISGLKLPSFAAPILIDAELPPRSPTATPEPPKTLDSPMGSTIVLDVHATSPLTTDLWTIVQWQDALGEWHNVEGWQGGLNLNLKVIWWVAPENFGEGPFRWVVYKQRNYDEVVAVSESFELPTHDKETVQVEVVLP